MNTRPVAGHQPEELNPSLSTSPSQEAAKSKKVAGPQPPFLQPAQNPPLLLGSSFCCLGLFGVVRLGPRLGREGRRAGEREGGTWSGQEAAAAPSARRAGGAGAAAAGGSGEPGLAGAGRCRGVPPDPALAEPRWQQSPAVSRAAPRPGDIAGVCHRCLPLHPAWGSSLCCRAGARGLRCCPLRSLSSSFYSKLWSTIDQ